MADTEDVAKVLFEFILGLEYMDESGYTAGYVVGFTCPTPAEEVKDRLEMLANECGIGIEVARRLLWVDQHPVE